jgi:Transposase domain (DUF772)
MGSTISSKRNAPVSMPRRWADPDCRLGSISGYCWRYFEGIDAERGIAWRAADSLALRDFLGVGLDQAPPDHSTISRTRRLIALETHRAVFALGSAVLEYGRLGQREDDRH